LFPEGTALVCLSSKDKRIIADGILPNTQADVLVELQKNIEKAHENKNALFKFDKQFSILKRPKMFNILLLLALIVIAQVSAFSVTICNYYTDCTYNATNCGDPTGGEGWDGQCVPADGGGYQTGSCSGGALTLQKYSDSACQTAVGSPDTIATACDASAAFPQMTVTCSPASMATPTAMLMAAVATLALFMF